MNLMMKENQNEEVHSRREFFKKAARSILPAIAVIALANSPVLAKASEVAMGCDSYCSGTCKGACSTTCTGTCKAGCGGCGSTCAGKCQGKCDGVCRSSCYNNCQSGSNK